MKERIQVGSKVYLKPVNNATRRGNKEIIEAEIIKVGRKYFELDRGGITKYEIATLRQVTQYAPDYELYFSKEEILEEREYNQLFGEIQTKFGTWSTRDLSLDQLRRMHAIMNE